MVTARPAKICTRYQQNLHCSASFNAKEMAVRAVQVQGLQGQQGAVPVPSPARPLRPLNALCAAKRKSAVELLQESKAFYVKSDCVRERQQRLQGPLPRSSPPSPSPVAPLTPGVGTGPTPSLLSPPPSPLLSPCSAGEPMPPAPPGFQQDSGPPPVSPRSLLLPKSPRLDTPRHSHSGMTWAQRRVASQQLQSDRLQTKLRRLLNADSKENVCYDNSSSSRRPDHDETIRVAGERAALNRSYGRSNSHIQGSYHMRAWSDQASCSLHKSLPDLHSSPTQNRRILPRWSSDNSSTRGSPSSSRSGDGDYAEHGHHRSGSQRGHRSLQYSGDAMSVVSSGGRTHQSHRGGGGSELRRGGSSGSSSGQGRARANTVSETLIRQSSGGSSGMSSWSPRFRSRPSSQYHSPRNSGTACGDECDSRDSRGSRGSRGSLGSRGSSHGSDHENFSSPQHCSRVAELCWNFEPRRPILRSKSDISHRYSATSIPLSPPCQDPAQLEVFFEQLGLDNPEYRYVSQTRSHSSDSPVFFSSVSSVDSNCGGWNVPWSTHSASAGGTTGTGGGFMGSGHSGKSIEQPSIVERNARIIKWLCNCRKAQKEMCQALGNGNMN